MVAPREADRSKSKDWTAAAGDGKTKRCAYVPYVRSGEPSISRSLPRDLSPNPSGVNALPCLAQLPNCNQTHQYHVSLRLPRFLSRTIWHFVGRCLCRPIGKLTNSVLLSCHCLLLTCHIFPTCTPSRFAFSHYRLMETFVLHSLLSFTFLHE